ncbi:MAG: DUF6163 family protein [Pseudomonadota bacterium]
MNTRVNASRDSRIEVARFEPTRAYRVVEFLFHTILRLLALLFLAFSLYTWARAVGFWPDPQLRFDTMDNPQRIYIAVLAVLSPVTAVGLWTTLSWARVVWFMTIAFQAVMIMWYPTVSAHGGWLIVFHAASLALYLLFQIALGFMRKEA